jgi:hypothetical protein
MLLLASITQNSFEPAGLSEKAQQATFEFSEDCPMNLLKAIVVGLVICGSALSYAEVTTAQLNLMKNSEQIKNEFTEPNPPNEK